MTTEEYYTAPKQEVFEEIKSKAIEIWETYDNQFGYVDEKVNQIKDIKNIRDNTAYMVAMFDLDNQIKLLSKVNAETRDWLIRLLDTKNEN